MMKIYLKKLGEKKRNKRNLWKVLNKKRKGALFEEIFNEKN